MFHSSQPLSPHAMLMVCSSWLMTDRTWNVINHPQLLSVECEPPCKSLNILVWQAKSLITLKLTCWWNGQLPWLPYRICPFFKKNSLCQGVSRGGGGSTAGIDWFTKLCRTGMRNEILRNHHQCGLISQQFHQKFLHDLVNTAGHFF